jgi:hypothetical protein
MALVECSYCHARISERAAFCPKCGLDRRIVCEDCQTALPPTHHGACPECGNPTPGEGVTLINAPVVLEAVPDTEHIEDQAEARYQELLEQDNRYLSFRLLVGIVLGLFSGWWLTAGFVKHGFLEFLPIMVIIAAIGMAYPRFFAIVTVLGMIAKLYLAVIE